jgi:DNA (cytosine-5)-methyltransferase 1
MSRLATGRGEGVRVGSLCTGYGGLDLGVTAWLDSARLCWCADDDPDVGRILTARFPGVVNLGDIRGIEWAAVERVEVLTAGFPCQDISAAGRGRGIEEGTRSGVWIDVVEAVRLLRPWLLVVENVAALRWRGLGRVLGDLAEAGYDAIWCSVRACDIGAPHRRERVFVAATAQDTHHPTRDQRRVTAPGQAALRRARPDAGRRGGAPAPHTEGERWNEGQPEPARLQRRPEPALSGDPDHPSSTTGRWGPYEAAILRWQHILGRPAPPPTEPGRGGRPRLSPRFVEWMMGLDEGHVTDLDLPRAAQLRVLGNGVIPRQAEHALTLLSELNQLRLPDDLDAPPSGRENP